jgi:DNA-binding CsgD family transcriptional regulator
VGTIVAPQQCFTALLRSSTVGIAVCDRKLRFHTINQALASMNGIPAPDHIGKKLHQILGSVAARVIPAFERVFDTGAPLSNFILVGQLPARTEVAQWVEDYYPIKNKSGKVVQVCVIALEVSPSESIDHVGLSLTRHRLSFREQQVIRLLAEGKSNKEMAITLGISVRTVETYRTRMMLKLDLRSIAEVVRYAVRHKII